MNDREYEIYKIGEYNHNQDSDFIRNKLVEEMAELIVALQKDIYNDKELIDRKIERTKERLGI